MRCARRTSTRRWGRGAAALGVAAAVAVGAMAGPALAAHWAKLGWRDLHISYPVKPSGYAEIVERFGQPCNANASKISMQVKAADNDVWYTVRFHKKLGGMRTAMVADQGGTSTNLDNDVLGHIRNEHLAKYLLSGIWGYACRYIAGTTTWSTHAWGIAVDVSASYEPAGQCTSTVNYNHAPIWKDHRWKWGKSFCDPMHFQYARDY